MHLFIQLFISSLIHLFVFFVYYIRRPTIDWPSILIIIGLFCKRAPQKRRYAAKETYNDRIFSQFFFPVTTKKKSNLCAQKKRVFFRVFSVPYSREPTIECSLDFDNYLVIIIYLLLLIYIFIHSCICLIV